MLNDDLLTRVQQLGLHGLAVHWSEVNETISLQTLVEWEEVERQARGLNYRLKQAKLGRFKAMADFDWHWPKKCDREHIEELLRLDFMSENANVILLGPNGVGKTTIAANILYQAVLNGYHSLFVTASQMLNDLASQDGDLALSRRLKYYAKPALLCIDEMGYLSYSNRHADLLFEIISRRYKKRSTVVTTNKPFIEWDQIFPNAACVISLVDRLVHTSESVIIEAESFRLKEAKERNGRRKKVTPEIPT